MRASARHADASSSGIASSGECALRGWSIAASAAAVVKIHNGTTASGDLLASLELPINTSDATEVDVWAPDGVYIEVVSGTVTGAVYIG